jgi:hypothetical protein
MRSKPTIQSVHPWSEFCHDHPILSSQTKTVPCSLRIGHSSFKIFPFNFCEHLRPSVGDMTSPLVRFARPSFIVVRLPGVSAPTRFRLDDKGTLCTLPERHSRRSRSSDEIETGVAIPHPVYKFTDQRIDWGADAPTPESVATPLDRSRAVPEPPSSLGLSPGGAGIPASPPMRPARGAALERAVRRHRPRASHRRRIVAV